MSEPIETDEAATEFDDQSSSELLVEEVSIDGLCGVY
jgi:mycofactocin precursor